MVAAHLQILKKLKIKEIKYQSE